ncbi:tripeptidyl-peptidase-like protein [Periconia macrospinosa]|uniref:tripeptidyl-peptidase II n=1 Tax=Periconia macrospinosa TaxID=97972 RepID=A0A2V1DJK9_9PLEO|nr:tripeptidyl-peptidase-like protein [Periconia macrospinosa]
MRAALIASFLAATGVYARTTLHVERDEVENLRHVPQGWKELDVAPSPDKKLHFRIGMHSPNHDLFEQTLFAVSTPDHPRYGKHLKREELKDLIKPRAEATSGVLQWLEDSNIPSEDIVNDGEWINFIAPISKAQNMLNTTFKTYQSLVRPEITKIRTLHYSVPKEIRDHVDLIQPTTRFGEIRPQHSNVHILEEVPSFSTAAAVNITCNTTITPQCLKDLYNFADYTPGNASVTIGVTGYLEQYARFKDWAQFAASYAPFAVGSNFTWTSVNGGILDQRATNSSVEANLDVQYTLGLVAPDLKVNFYSTPNRGLLIPDLDQPTQADNQNEPYLDFFTYAVGLPDDELPQVISTSYGENEQSVPVEYSKKVCDLIGQLGTRGVSVIFSSGDTGVGGACQTNDGKNTTRFLPIFPAACPYVTSVGGTVNVEPEIAVDFSSGGFSDIWPRPAYQESAVSSYLSKLGSRWENLYNPKGRGFPDIAAQGLRFRIVDKGTEFHIGGTSASAPVVASIVGLLNNARLSSGQSALGFLNPWLYSTGYKGLNDITGGGSSGCTGTDPYSGLKTPFIPYASWNATEGWDPVTGLGTPDFGKLLQLSKNSSYGYGKH